MTFDNSKTIISLRIKLFGVTIILLTFIVLTYIARLIRYPLLGMSETAWTLILVSLYLVYAFLPMFLNYQYVWYSDEEDTIVFRYFRTGMGGSRKNSIEINKKTFTGYKTETRYFGFMQSITLYQKINEKSARYPPVYISALTAAERKKILDSLNLYSPGK
jgi:hypothetical protein